jgi:hypothetical protein
MRKEGALLAAACALAGCGSSGSAISRGDRDAGDVFELTAKFDGKAAAILGSSHE